MKPTFMLLGPILALLVARTSAQAAPAGNTTNACPIRDFSKVFWNTTKAACADPSSATFCNSCTCGIGVALVTGLQAAGVTVNGQPLSILAAADPAAFRRILDQCQGNLGVRLLQSGAVPADGAVTLAQCDVQAAADACLQQHQQAAGTVNALQQSMRSGASGSSKPAGWLGSGVLGLMMLGAALLLP